MLKAEMAACLVVPDSLRFATLATPHRISTELRDSEPSLRTPTVLTPSVGRLAPTCGPGDMPTTDYEYHTQTLKTSGYMLRKAQWKYVGYPAQLFNIESDSQELNNVCAERPDIARQLHSELRSIVDYEQTHRDLVAYNKEEFRQWRRQAM